MIVGNGLIARAFSKYIDNDNVIIFASGVSNSKENTIDEFDREEALLNLYLDKYGNHKYFVYFSTCSIYDTYFEKSDYIKHKINMEKIIINKASHYSIFRLSQVLGKNNKSQLVGFLYEAIKTEKSFKLYDIERNIIDVQDVFLIADIILQEGIFENQIINIANIKNIRVLDLVDIIEKIIGKKAKYSLIEKKGNFMVDIKKIETIILNSNIFKQNYLENRIKKYYD